MQALLAGLFLFAGGSKLVGPLPPIGQRGIATALIPLIVGGLCAFVAWGRSRPASVC